MSNDRIWVTWEVQRRNRSLSGRVDAKLYEFDLRRNRFIRYIVLIIKTLFVYIKENPECIFVQNPSMILSLMTVIYGKIANKKIIVDAHNAGLRPFEGKYRIANKLCDRIIKSADTVIVSNEGLCAHVEGRGGVPFVLPDPIPTIDGGGNVLKLKGRKNVFFICTYSSDEPYVEVSEAARLIPEEYYVYISGRVRGDARDKLGDLPANVILTGYLSDDEFADMLRSSDVIMDLTTRKDCLVCGAYEAIAVGKPLILSDTEVSRNYFSRGVVYTKNDPYSISESIMRACGEIAELEKQVRDLRGTLERQWDIKLQLLQERLDPRCGP